ncbi:uncharacterized protein LOC132563084 [Ylistrum balloti]|uniref:uncharacterized protein LOC132563084 n=1 Tax=Ylistrum balloti TaxID=509963 RepID=UPI0029059A97|nr:uncharacterized protein LOC132552759 isoform X1 [Ylistrum balloti]XP_060083825.1 uncharacterized protein LOC132563084 [Ylistrum balloti]
MLCPHLKDLLDQERRQRSELASRLEEIKKVPIFGVERFKYSPCDIQFYTGLPDYLTCLALCDFLLPEKHKINSFYYQQKETDSTYVNRNRGRDPNLSVQEQLFLVLCCLRQGYREQDLAHRFNISQSCVSVIFSKWIKHMGHVLTTLNIWAPKETINKNMPQTFKDLNYGNTRCIVDCTEIFLQQPSSNLVLQTVLFSSYKNHHTAKALVAIAPHGPVTFVSDLYAGSASDFDITKDCGLLNLLEPGDHVMADKGFEIQPLLDNLRVRVDHPPVLRGVQQMSVEQETTTRRIARLRIHVERAIERIKIIGFFRKASNINNGVY